MNNSSKVYVFAESIMDLIKLLSMADSGKYAIFQATNF